MGTHSVYATTVPFWHTWAVEMLAKSRVMSKLATPETGAAGPPRSPNVTAL
ncbi:MAG: hypothetical protein NVS9B4_00480 [Candidatus Acidiferrum sp.]